MIQFYNRFACEIQRCTILAKNKLSARYKFWEKYPKNKYHDCIDYIAGVKA